MGRYGPSIIQDVGGRKRKATKASGHQCRRSPLAASDEKVAPAVVRQIVIGRETIVRLTPLPCPTQSDPPRIFTRVKPKLTLASKAVKIG